MYAQQVQPGYAGLRAEINALSAAGPTCKHRDTKSAVAQLVDALRLFVPNETAFEHLNSCRNNYSQGYGDFLRNGVASVARQIHDNRKIDAATIARPCSRSSQAEVTDSTRNAGQLAQAPRIRNRERATAHTIQTAYVSSSQREGYDRASQAPPQIVRRPTLCLPYYAAQAHVW